MSTDVQAANRAHLHRILDILRGVREVTEDVVERVTREVEQTAEPMTPEAVFFLVRGVEKEREA